MAKKVIATTVTTVLVGLFFSFLAAMSLYQSEQQSIEHEIQKDVENSALSLRRELNIGIELLYALRNQVILGNETNEGTFVMWSEQIMDRHPIIHSMAWVEHITHEERQSYEEDVALELAPFKIVERNVYSDFVKANLRSHYFPVRYVIPPENNQNVLGFDLGSRSSMNDLLEISWYRGVPIATPAIRLKHEFEERSGFMIFLPVFYGTPEIDVDRKSALRGFVVALFGVQDIFDFAINNTVNESINFELIDKSVEEPYEIIFDNMVSLSDPSTIQFTYTSNPIYFAGREWVLKGTSTSAYVYSRMSIYPYLIFFVGVIIFTLLAYLLYVLQHRALMVQKRVDIKTRALREANKKLEKMSKSDGLTGHYNRAYFNDSLKSEVKRSYRDRLAISMLIIEIDEMSQYNTKHGRVAGDKAIRLISQALVDKLKRPSDFLARYSGESFAILLPNTKDGRPIAKMCIEAVKMLKLPFDQESGNDIISISIGGVTVLDANTIDASRLIAYAEIALSKAEAGGRNQCHWIYAPERNQPKIRD